LDSRLPKLIFVLLVLYAAVHSSSVYPRLPGVVASHFNGRGAPNGWQTKEAFLTVFAVVSVIAVLIGVGIPKILAAVPAQRINLPNKNYWLAPERLRETMAFLNAYFAWFARALFLFDILVFNYTIQRNLHPANPPDSARLWYMIGGFLLFTMVWAVRMLAKFFRSPDKGDKGSDG
jgi:uncharacterized membrane protein